MANTITINNKEYNVDDMSEETRGQIRSLRYANKRIADLENDLAVSQTAINTYGHSLGRNMPKPAHPNKKNGVVVINDTKYVLDDFEGEARDLVFSIHKAQQRQSELKGDLALLKTARNAYERELGKAL